MNVEHSKAQKRRAPAAAAPVDTLLSVRDVATALGTTPKHVYNLRSQGHLPPAVDIPGLSLRWKSSVFYAWLASRT